MSAPPRQEPGSREYLTGTRYETANALAEDLRRHLENVPVVARPPSAAYRLQKAWRRNKLVFTAAAAVVAVLVLGITASTWQAIKATKARKAAVQAQLAAQAAQNEAQQSREAEKQERVRADAEAAEAQKQAERADANARRFGRDLYIADMRLAQQAWEAARIYRLQELLDGQRPERTTGIDLRGFEWYYWQRLSHTDLLTLEGGMACCVAFSPDGTRLATSGDDGKLSVCDASTGKKIPSLDGHKGTVWVVAFSPDGKHLASAMCCGAGGGRMWLEETIGERINVARVRQLLDARPGIIGTACPYCPVMVGDGLKALGREDEVRVLDLAELVAASLPDAARPQAPSP